ncbi:MAG: LPS export ABC transporter periplasmic protein LptC [Marinilabiliales bacterium]|nr:MAG: LPS export ABC transporter periplasmic protein LptC [Marinilabiliales bacterium]
MKLKHIKSIIMVLAVVMLFSCENPIAEVQEIAKVDTLPSVSAFNIEYLRTSEARRQVILRSPQMDRYTDKSNEYSEFPKGFEVTFYDTLGNESSYIKADYGIDYINKKRLEARNNVIVKNLQTQEQLSTENLVWDRRKRIIYSSSFVKITSPDKVIYGDSLWATEDFSKRRIHQIKNSYFEIEEDSIN